MRIQKPMGCRPSLNLLIVSLKPEKNGIRISTDKPTTSRGTLGNLRASTE